jgi:hypothetical protein
MKQIDFTGSENVVNIQSPEKIDIIGERITSNNSAVLLVASDHKNSFNSEKNRALNHSGIFSKDFETFVSCESYLILQIQ